ncbi:hypothetical protein Nepgr_029225 [Nepenthes gracilis]|uniref:Secreted protein n=1 Tax=Nepenthes gracilis TaxID=150966 RepID=A0AAD3TDK2_NEPGR|nr:hypothetical protein Nepgr_029225 [Nepenthes gracilis]
MPAAIFCFLTFVSCSSFSTSRLGLRDGDYGGGAGLQTFLYSTSRKWRAEKKDTRRKKKYQHAIERREVAIDDLDWLCCA